MSKKSFLLVVSVVLVFGFLAACGKSEEEKKIQQTREWELQNFSEGQTAKPKPKPLPKDLVVVVPESVKARYKVVSMGVADLKTKEIKNFTVRIGETAKVPGTDYTVKIDAYLPTWKVVGNTVTSKGDNPVDPAVRAIIFEKDKKVFDGFIFQRAKTPSFMTDKYVIGLVGAK